MPKPPDKRGKSAAPEASRERLQKVLAAAGLGSRRECEPLIVDGRVTVNGQVVNRLGATVDPSSDSIEVDGERIRPERRTYYMLNKPPGVVCTNRDPSGRRRVIDLFPSDSPRLFTVGRLDESSQGLLIVTNDGKLAHQLAHPRFQIARKYRVQVAGTPTRETLNQLRRGLHFTEGKFRVKGVRKIRTRGKSTELEIELAGGQNREIRRLLARVGHKVMRLERISFGTLKLGRLPLGQYRALKPKELDGLREVQSPAARGRVARKRSSSTRAKRKPRK